MKCPGCQTEARPGQRFCTACGAKLASLCPGCGAVGDPGDQFCGECGHPLGGQSRAIPAAPTPESYTPRHLAEKILTSRAALEGERKHVTVLFADLKGSMELLADRDAEAARKLLDPVLERMMEAVHRYEGTVNQVMGDGIMALFGAPLAHEDHAIRACYAALRMQEVVRCYAEEVHRVEGVPIQIRVGVNSGEVVVRAIGSDLRMDYSAVGQTTHVAARMEQMAMPGSILLSAETLRLVEGHIVVRPLGPRPVKGLDAPIEVYELNGTGVTRSRLQAAAARGLTRFVGRDGELDRLRQALEQARGGHGQVAAIVGEPGVGKSRLVWELTHSHRTHGWLVLESGSVSYGKATSYLPVIDLLKGYFKIQDRDDSREMREKVIGKLLGLDRALEPTLPAFLALLDVPVDDPQWQGLDPPQRRQKTLDAVRRLLLRESQGQPLLVVFEDLQWVDSASQALLDGLVESLPAAPLLLLVNYRPEYRHGWGGKTYYTQLRLDPLLPESAEALLRTLLGDDPGLQSLKALLAERTEGNPFFLEESVRALVETGQLVGERGAYRPAAGLPDIQVPARVQAILAARIDRLAPDDKRLLQTASALGKDIPFPLLQAIAELPETELRQTLGRLQSAEFLYEARLFPDLEYTFKHALTHEVAYGGLLHDRRCRLHARIVEAIEAFHADRLAEQVDRLAHHAVRGELWSRAVSYLRQAGARAVARSANREGVACFEQALAALPHLPETRETLEQAIDLRFELRTALIPLGLLEQGIENLRQAERSVRALDDQPRLGWLSLYMSHSLFLTGRLTEARTHGQTAHAIAGALQDWRLQVAADFYLGSVCFASGDLPGAQGFLLEVIRVLGGERSRERCSLTGFPAVMARGYLAWVLAERGAFEDGTGHGREGIRLGEAIEHPYSLALACWTFAHLHAIRGQMGEAIPMLQRALALARDSNFAAGSALFACTLGYVYTRAGRVSEGLSLLEQGVLATESIGLLAFHSCRVGYLSEGYLLAGRPADARAAAGRALALARERDGRPSEAYALRLLGKVAAHPDASDAETAERHYREAIALAGELSMRPLVARCHLGLGALYRRTGRPQEAQAHHTVATALLDELGMPSWLERS